MRRSYLLVATLLWLALATPASAQVFAYLAFGDSITRGKCDNGTCSSDEKAGYPLRLETLLGCSPSICSVDNKGKDGERTTAAVTRIDSVLDSATYDVLLLMHGTNDIWANISNGTIRANLATMATKAADRGVDTVHASIIRWHPDGPNGTSQDADIEDLRNRIMTLAAAGNGYFVDPWSVLCPSMACFNAHYAPIPPDNGLHPDASGYDILAAEFAGEITSEPAPTAPTPVAPTDTVVEPVTFTWNRESPIRATWYELSIDGPSGPVSSWASARDVCAGGACSFTPTIEWTEGEHSWRVRGRNPNGRSAWSADQGFEVYIGPPAFFLGPPVWMAPLSAGPDGS